MAPLRSSNMQRRLGRDECREKLSEHIQSRLGISVKPAEVRLNPRPNDPYVWKVMPGMEACFSQIFAKNLSDHSIGTYRLLCEGVGKTFEALPSAVQGSGLAGSITTLPDSSFSARIDQLKKDNERLSQEVCEWKGQAVAEMERRQAAEGEIQRLHGVQGELHDQVQSQMAAVACLRRILLSCTTGLDTIRPILEGLRKDLVVEGFES